MIVRPAAAADTAILHALLSELAAFEGGIMSAGLADLQRDLGTRFEALLAERDGEILGVLVFFPTYASWRGRPALMIHDLFVREPARGQGAATALVTELKRIAGERNCCRIEVNVLEGNARARAFYERMELRWNEGWLGYRGEISEPTRSTTAD